MVAKEVATVLRTESHDSTFLLATVTGAKISSDLKIAHVYISVMGSSAERKSVFAKLEQATGFFRRRIGQSLKLKYTPEIRFVLDDTLERAERILSELEALNIKQDDDVPSDDLE